MLSRRACGGGGSGRIVTTTPVTRPGSWSGGRTLKQATELLGCLDEFLPSGSLFIVVPSAARPGTGFSNRENSPFNVKGERDLNVVTFRWGGVEHAGERDSD
jgi:hypothetical protein